MSTTAVSHNRTQWILIGTVVLAAIVGGTLRIFSAKEAPISQTSVETVEESQQSASNETAQLFESPMVTLSAEMRKAATPSELVTSTRSDERLSVVTTGRVDPFAPITQTIGATSSRAKPPTAASPTVPPVAVSPGIPLPTTAVSNTPDLPPVPTVNFAPQPLPSLPPIPVAANPLPIPSSLPNSLPQSISIPQDPVQAVQLTGVVQVGDRIGVIVREGNGQTSRHLFEGDMLAGGQIRIKSIDLSAQEPLVILEYQGKEYPRMVG